MGLARVTDLNVKIVKASTTQVFAPIKIKDLEDRCAIVSDELPFRVRFTNIEIPGYGPSTVPPIGIAIVGENNYIL